MRNNILYILAGMFALSLLGRSFAMTMQAENPVLSAAENIRAAADRDRTETAMRRATAETPTEFFNDQVCASGPLLAAIKDREEELAEKQDAYEERMQTLAAVEQRVEERMAVLDRMNDKLSTAINAIEAESNNDITHLASMYENMKPQEASAIFNQMDPSFAAGFLRIMNSTNAGLIMAGMDPEKAYSISVELANRNAGYREALSN